MSEELAEIGEDRSLLLLDDDEPFLRRLAKAMEKRGFEVETAETVAAGKAWFLAEMVRLYDHAVPANPKYQEWLY